MSEIPGLDPASKKGSAGRKPGTTKISASARIASLTDTMAAMIESRVVRVRNDITELDAASSGEVNPATTAANLDIADKLAGLLKQLMQIQKLRNEAGQEDGDALGDAGDGEAIVRELLGR